MSDWLIRSAECVEPGAAPRRRDVRIRGERIEAVAERLAPTRAETVVEAAGGALLPGLRDHHIHLMALAAARTSIRCGPPEIHDAEALADRLRAAATRPGATGVHGALRGVGYHESVAGWLDRHALDAWVPDRPLRIQHRSGAMWILNTAALAALRVDQADWPPGAERDANGQPTGRLHRLDAWLRERLGADEPPDLAEVGALLAQRGVTGVCDATATNDAGSLAHLERAAASGALPQRLLVMGTASLPEPTHPRVRRGAVKLMLDEDRLPRLDDVVHAVEAAHHAQRSAAFHCVTRAELVFALGALECAGVRAGDRIEHASVAPPELVERVRALGLRVVTQPNFLLERGDAYLRDVEPRDLPWLYRGRGLVDAGIALAGGTDAPFGEPDPWAAMRAAVTRRSASGAALSPDEALSPEQALALFTSPLASPGAPPVRIEPGAPADLCLLDRPWSRAREALVAEHVRTTWVAGEAVHGAGCRRAG